MTIALRSWPRALALKLALVAGVGALVLASPAQAQESGTGASATKNCPGADGDTRPDHHLHLHGCEHRRLPCRGHGADGDRARSRVGPPSISAAPSPVERSSTKVTPWRRTPRVQGRSRSRSRTIRRSATRSCIDRSARSRSRYTQFPVAVDGRRVRDARRRPSGARRHHDHEDGGCALQGRRPGHLHLQDLQRRRRRGEPWQRHRHAARQPHGVLPGHLGAGPVRHGCADAYGASR